LSGAAAGAGVPAGDLSGDPSGDALALASVGEAVGVTGLAEGLKVASGGRGGPWANWPRFGSVGEAGRVDWPLGSGAFSV
jgi:hypothetical protein